MSDGTYQTHTDVAGLSPAQRHHLDEGLRAEGIHVTWAGDQVQFDRAFEARVESLVAEARRQPAGPAPAGTPGAPGAPAYAPTAPPYLATGPAAYPPAGAAPYGAAPYGSPAYGFYQPQTTNSNAVIALVLGIGSFAVCGLCCIPAIILGRRAEREIAESQGAQSGAGMAKAGWIIGTVYAGLFGVGMLIFLIFIVVAAVSTPT